MDASSSSQSSESARPTAGRMSGKKEVVFNDPIHGSIKLDPLLVTIIQTPQFERLRDIKQLGGAYYVYPGASHNRFEHSIGVCHLAGQLLRELRETHKNDADNPMKDITDRNILMVEIAGLCHDLGHGPFSHVFDKQYMPLAVKDGPEHEDISLKMFDHMIEENPHLKREITQDEISVIKKLIHNKEKDWDTFVQSIPEEYRKKTFLFQVVANKENGVDVDKWDYFKRDAYCLGMQTAFDHNRLMKFCRVIEDNGKWHICPRDKEAFNVHQMFLTRQTLHRQAYQHKTVKATEMMIVHGLLAAEAAIRDPDKTVHGLLTEKGKGFTIPGKDGKSLKPSQCHTDMVAYTKLTDRIFYDIVNSVDPELATARQWLRDVQIRKIYKLVAESAPFPPGKEDKDTQEDKKLSEDDKKLPKEDEDYTFKLQQDIIKEMSEDDKTWLKEDDNYTFQLKENGPRIPEYRFVFQTLRLDMGMKSKNPLDKVLFFTKDEEHTPMIVKPEEISALLPTDKVEEMKVRVLLRPSDDKVKDETCHKVLKKAFQSWHAKELGELKEPRVYPWTYNRYSDKKK